MSDEPNGLGEAIAQQSAQLESQSDFFPTGASFVVTRAAAAEGNAVTVVLHEAEEGVDADEDLVLGFDDDTFDSVAADMARASTDEWVRLTEQHARVFQGILDRTRHDLSVDQQEELRALIEAAPEPADTNEGPELGDFS